jgi:hypothetical protein
MMRWTAVEAAGLTGIGNLPAAQQGGFGMDRDRFDALARLLGASGSRRATLGALVGAALLGGGLETAAKSKKGKKPKTCFGTKSCPFPSDGQDFEQCNLAGVSAADCNGCDFRGADLGNADFSHVKVQGASFRNANLRNAFFDFADASGASFRDACLVGTDFFGADLHGASLRGAILCHTIFPNGQVRNGGCDKVDKCCPTCVGIGEACGSSEECCGQVPCLGGQCLECVKDVDCPEGERCIDNQCVEIECVKDSDCPNGLICLDNQCVECQKDSDCPSDCVCANLAPGPGKLCVDPFNGCDDPCDEGCPSGQVCVDDGFCGFDHCHPP